MQTALSSENPFESSGASETQPVGGNAESTAPAPTRPIRIKVIGVGGAGGNAVTHMVGEGFPGVEFIAINTDAQALDRCAAREKLVLGSGITRGLGTGGDPELGRATAEQDCEKIRALCAGADIVFMVAGLGGGTGTGAGPVVAQAAKDAGALVLGIVTTPFDFEGGRRQQQAQQGLQLLKFSADSVICVPNQKVLKLVDEKTSVVEGFKICNELLAGGVRGIWRLLTQTGLINIDFADLCAITRGRHADSSFAAAEATGENRGERVAEKLMAHPLIESGQILSQADSVLISIQGGPDLTMAEVNRVMELIGRHCENAHVIMGAAIDAKFANRLSVTLVASKRSEDHQSARGGGEASVPPAAAPAPDSTSGSAGSPTENLLDPGKTARPSSRFVPPPPPLTPERKEQLSRQRGRGWKNAARVLQRELPLEIVSKGRFEKSEPTIHRGEDLDVPTYIRRGIALN
jgi:cell division protein FtsZ